MSAAYIRNLAEHFKSGKLVEAKKGEVILQAEQSSDYLYYIAKGFVKVYTISDEGHCSIVAIKGPGEIVLLHTLLSRAPNHFFYEAVTPLRLKKRLKSEIEAEMSLDVNLACALLECSLALVRNYEDRLQNLEVKDARRRVIRRLLFLEEKFGRTRQGKRSAINLPINYQDLADALNITRETANREVSQLADEGLVEKKRNLIYILDGSRLEAALKAQV